MCATNRYILISLLGVFTLILAKPTTIDLDPNVPFIETFVSGIPEDQFKDDRVLIHSVKDGRSQFLNLASRKKGSVVFQLKAIPEGKSIILLSGFDDNIRRSKREATEQRTYVVLRKKSDSNDNYFINYAYVRNLFTGENTEGSVEISGKHKRIEFDVWDARGASNNWDNLFGWSTCSKTFLVTCTGDPNVQPRMDDEEEPDYDVAETLDANNNDTASSDPPPPPTDPADQPVEQSTVELNFDFFTDLDDEAEHSWFVGANIIFVTNTKLRVQTTFQPAEIHDMEIQVPEMPERKKRQEGKSGGPPNNKTLLFAKKMQACYEYVRQKNIGGQGGGLFDKSMHSVSTGVQEDVIGGAGDDGRLRNGSDRRGLYGDKDGPGGGLLAPVDGLAQGIGNIFGYGGGQNASTPGMQLANGIRNGGGLGYGFSEGAADTLGTALGVGTISDDRSHLDGIMDEALPGVFGNTFGAAVDIVNVIAKPLGLEPLLGSLAGLTGFLFGGALGGPGAAVVGPAKLALDFGKVAFKALGLGGLIGMKGSSNKGLQVFCLNHILKLDAKAKQDRAGKAEAAQGGRTFGSSAATFTKSGAEDNVDIYSPLGWRGLLSFKQQPFVGFGSCYVKNASEIIATDFAAVKSPEERGELYLKSMRTDCNPKQVGQLNSLLQAKYLRAGADGDHPFTWDPELMKKVKLSIPELNSLSLAFEMSIYSEVFEDGLKNKWAPITPDGKNYSLSVHALQKMSLSVLNKAAETGGAHVVKLVRNQIVTLKTAMVKLLQDSQILTLCRRCLIGDRLDLDKNIEMVLATNLFLLNKFEPAMVNADKNSFAISDLEAEFIVYYHANIDDIRKEIQLYTIFPITGRYG